MKNQKKTVLFVEDDPLILMLYRNRLEREGFQVEVVADGLEALETLPLIKPTLVILDLMLPMLDGLDVLRFIREDADLKATPVLILSNAYMDDQVKKALQAGASKGLLKTECTPTKLMETIHELLGENATQTSRENFKANVALSESDAIALKKTRDDLLKEAPAEIAKIREHCLAYVKSAGASTENLKELYQRVRFFCGRASLSECTKIAHLSTALEAMLFEIIFKSTTPSPSALQTIAQAVDCLGRLFENGDTQSSEATLKAKVLVVDDDPICTFATESALKRAKLEAISTQDPGQSLQIASAEAFDIVLLDINMPGLNGFEVCERLRGLPAYANTPVIFVSSNSDFQNKAQSVLSGGNDLIAKPISSLELTLKTVMHLIESNGRMVQPRAARKAPAAAKENHQETISPPPRLNGKPKTNGTSARSDGHGDALPFLKMASGMQDFSKPTFSVPKALPTNRIDLAHNLRKECNVHETFMKNPDQSDQSFNKLSAEVARIMFGDEISDMSMRLTRIALERYNVPEMISSGKPNESLDGIAREVGRIIFGDDKVSEMHLRLTRIALERYNVPEIITHTPEINGNGRNGSHSEHRVPDMVVNL